ncbi:hypothetical protein BGZ80_004572 [Entomortierella chlamydospora]|uniref:Protein kinase domain-containing protein n=1 Tax=Entomortierella chlamydospora TaxID=101097 RepID=A0A9P6SW00_9FUNG|nr:hypothetical protein BGZ80_004572 [Entomortierella chlamydospora]
MSQTDRFRSFASRSFTSSPLVSEPSSFANTDSTNNSLTGFISSASPVNTSDSLFPADQTQQNSVDGPQSNHSSKVDESLSQQDSILPSQPIEVKETLDATITKTMDGRLRLKQYVLTKIIGQGAYGIVSLGEDVNTKVKYREMSVTPDFSFAILKQAIKEFSKSKLSKKERASAFRYGRGRGRPNVVNSARASPLDMIKSEIAILKKLSHVNIVKLHEVLDVANADSMFMGILCEHGVLTEVSLGDKPGKIFEDEECRHYFQQMILGIEYLHEHDIIHRDIKPDNLLRSADDTLKIVDFGVSEMFSKKGDDVTKKSAGSPAFMAPEWCRYDHGELSGKPADIWSMGVTLYCMKYGRLPFRSSSSVELLRIIREEEPDLSETDPRFKNVMEKLLDKDPSKRITIDELRSDPWVTDDGHKPLKDKDENIQEAVVELTPYELQHAIQSVPALVTVFKAVSKFKSLLKNHPSKSSANKEELQKVDDDEVDEDVNSESVESSPIMLSLQFKGTDENHSESLPKPEPLHETKEEEEEKEEEAGFPVCDLDTGICYYPTAVTK